MNYARLVHILCSIWPYENGLIKKFKHKDQCSIYNASPSCFEKFLFLWKTCLNLYLKWVMTFRSPHHFFSFLFLFFFLFWRKKWPSFISTHQNILLVPLQIPSWMFTLYPDEGLAPSFKMFDPFLSFILKWALPLVLTYVNHVRNICQYRIG